MKKQSKAAKVRVLLAEGVSVQDIAKKLKMDVAYVHQIKFYWKNNIKKGERVDKTKPKFKRPPKSRLLSVLAKTRESLKPAEPLIFGPEKPISVPEPDMVNHPPHYKVGGIETIDFIEAKNLTYHLGNAVKYISRAYYKDNPLQDLKKARFYIDREISRRESKAA